MLKNSCEKKHASLLSISKLRHTKLKYKDNEGKNQLEKKLMKKTLEMQ